MPVVIAVDDVAGRLAILTERERIQAGAVVRDTSMSVLDTRTGSIGRSSAVSEPLVIDPNAAGAPLLAVDTCARRIIAVVAGGAYAPATQWDWIPAGLRARLPFLAHPTAHARAVAPRLVVRAES
jgi:hypothetical protein